MPKAMKENARSFTVTASSVNKDGGRYVNSKPDIAAKHAARVLFKAANGAAEKTGVYIKLIETTLGSKVTVDGKKVYKKPFFYHVTRELAAIDKSMSAMGWVSGRDGVYKYRVKSIDESEFVQKVRR